MRTLSGQIRGGSLLPAFRRLAARPVQGLFQGHLPGRRHSRGEKSRAFTRSSSGTNRDPFAVDCAKRGADDVECFVIAPRSPRP